MQLIAATLALCVALPLLLVAQYTTASTLAHRNSVRRPSRTSPCRRSWTDAVFSSSSPAGYSPPSLEEEYLRDMFYTACIVPKVGTNLKPADVRTVRYLEPAVLCVF